MMENSLYAFLLTFQYRTKAQKAHSRFEIRNSKYKIRDSKCEFQYLIFRKTFILTIVTCSKLRSFVRLLSHKLMILYHLLNNTFIKYFTHNEELKLLE